MAKNYGVRSDTAEKVISKQLEPPVFKVENVIMDSQAKSPRLLTSYHPNGMRRLTEQEKSLYYESQARRKEELNAAELEQRRDKERMGNQLLDERTNLLRNYQPNTYDFKEQMMDKLKKKNFPPKDSAYGFSSDAFNRQRQEGIQHKGKREEEKRSDAAGLDESMTDSTAKLVEKLVMEEKQEKAAFPLERTYNELYALIVSQEKHLDTLSKSFYERKNEEEKQRGEGREVLSLLHKIWQKVDKGEQPPAASEQHLKQELRQCSLRCLGLENERKALLAKNRVAEIERRELQAIQQKLTMTLRECEEKLKAAESRWRQLEEKLQVAQTNAVNGERKQGESIKFYSELAIESGVDGFLREAIQNFTRRAVVRARLLYQKDEWNTNLSNYLDRPPFPVLLLARTTRGVLFGAFAQGIETHCSAKGAAFGVVLFNGSTRTTFGKDERSKLACGLTYQDNHLRFGNNELSLKNHSLGQMSVSGGSIFGDKYFNLPRRHLLTGEENEVVEIRELELFEVFLE